MGILWQDIRFGLRMLARRPGFTTVAVLTLALGIGANTAIFSVVHAVLLEALPYPESDRIVTLWNSYPQSGAERSTFSPVDFVDWEAQSRSFSHLGAYYYSSYVLQGGGEGEAVRLVAARVMPEFFPALGVEPLLGGTLLPEDDTPGADRVVVLSHRVWQTRLGADAGIVGRAVVLDGEAYLVRGVMPPGFGFPHDRDLWTPLALRPTDLAAPQRGAVYLEAVGRLRTGVAVAEAQAEMSSIARRLEQDYPDTNTGRGVLVESLRDSLVGDVRGGLLLLQAAVAAVLLIACMNVSNLLLAQAAERRQELAIRSALGAGPWRLVRQVLAESLLLGGLGAGLGLMLVPWVLDLFGSVVAWDLPRQGAIEMNATVLLVMVAAAVLTSLLFGLTPTLLVANTSPQESLKAGGRGRTMGRNWSRFRSFLVVAEVTGATMLLVGALLFVRSFQKLQSVPSGFNPERVVTSYLRLPDRYDTSEARVEFFRSLVEKVRALPGVVSAGHSNTIPMQGSEMAWDYVVRSRPVPSPSEMPGARVNIVSSEYLQTMGVTLEAGRYLNDGDRAGAPQAVLVNRTLARQQWPDGSALGEKLLFGYPDGTEAESDYWEIVGVVGDVHHNGLAEESGPAVFLPHAQRGTSSGFLVVRSTAPEAGALEQSLRAAVSSLDPGLALSSYRTMEEYYSRSVAQPRFRTYLMSGFALLALLLAAMGVYGVLAHAVAVRIPEIGVRMALGATPGNVLAEFLRQGLALVCAGLALGWLGTLALARVLQSFLFDFEATDPTSYLLVGGMLGMVAVLTCLVPARRASAVDPIVALRYE